MASGAGTENRLIRIRGREVQHRSAVWTMAGSQHRDRYCKPTNHRRIQIGQGREAELQGRRTRWRAVPGCDGRRTDVGDARQRAVRGRLRHRHLHARSVPAGDDRADGLLDRLRGHGRARLLGWRFLLLHQPGSRPRGRDVGGVSFLCLLLDLRGFAHGPLCLLRQQVVPGSLRDQHSLADPGAGNDRLDLGARLSRCEAVGPLARHRAHPRGGHSRDLCVRHHFRGRHLQYRGAQRLQRLHAGRGADGR